MGGFGAGGNYGGGGLDEEHCDCYLTGDHFNNYLSSSPTSKVSTALRALSLETNNHELPIYEPLSEVAKKERNRAKFAENAADIDMQTKGSSAAAKVEGLTIEGDVDSDGTQTANLPQELGDLESVKQYGHRKAAVIRQTTL
ncbi:hypothetical protein ACH5RR_016950 [Cinchona calisaya]|uniref:Uncharacterized protein n=1 Tax=Cinchona calisaya TaxID=153742 RepID=A0ABD2ZXD5_9GENT